MSYHDELCPDAVSVIVQSPDSVSVQLPEQEDVVPSRREKCFNCCKKFTAFLCSTVGLTSMLVGYTIFGGFIFKNLESPHELRQKSAIKQSRAWHVQMLWNATLAMNVFYEENWTRMAEELLQNFTDQVYEATKKHGWDGTDGTADVQWTFAGAMLYSITVITTIGYGHIAPKTMWGRIVTILYAMIGIPLCLLTLTNLGGFMATAFRFIYNNICCGLCCLCCEYREKAQVRAAALKYKDTGNGDPGAAEALTGISSPESSESKGSKSPTKRKVSTTVTWRSGLKRVLKTEDNKAVRVPIYVSFLLITGYILSGAVLFTLWEKDWDYLEGSYFCFITLSTIGFGDFVPGTTQDSWNNQQKLVLCAMYLIIGLSLIAMCFDLMQEEARNKVRALGAKLGLFDDEKKASDSAHLEHAPRAMQTTSPAVPKPSKSSSSSSFKNFVLAKPKPVSSKSTSSLDTNNLEPATPEVHLTKRQRKALERERRAAEKREAEERKLRERRAHEEQKERERREQEEQKAREKRQEEERKLREKREKEEKKAAAKREKERLLRERRQKERERKERGRKKNRTKEGASEQVTVPSEGPMLRYTQIPRAPEVL